MRHLTRDAINDIIQTIGIVFVTTQIVGINVFLMIMVTQWLS